MYGFIIGHITFYWLLFSTFLSLLYGMLVGGCLNRKGNLACGLIPETLPLGLLLCRMQNSGRKASHRSTAPFYEGGFV